MFKTGDRVRATTTTKWVWEGMKGTVQNNSSIPWVYWDELDNEWTIADHHLELIKEDTMKVGDKRVVRKNLKSYTEMPFGVTLEMVELAGQTVTISKIVGPNEYRIKEENYLWNESMFEPLKGGKAMRPKNTKPVKTDPHVVLQDDCNNLVGFNDSLKEAEARASKHGTECACTVYKMTPISQFEPSVKKTKIK